MAHKGSALARTGTQLVLVIHTGDFQTAHVSRSPEIEPGSWVPVCRTVPQLCCRTYVALKWIVSVRLVLKEGCWAFLTSWKPLFYFFFSQCLNKMGNILFWDCFQGDCYITVINLFLRHLVTREKWWEAHWPVVATAFKILQTHYFLPRNCQTVP